MFKFLTLTIVSLSANAVLLQMDDAGEGECDLFGGCISCADLEDTDACPLVVPDQMDLPPGMPSCGETVCDEIVDEFTCRQALRVDAACQRKINKAARDAILALSQPDYTTKDTSATADDE